MHRFESNPHKDAVLDQVFSFLRGKKQGFLLRIRDEGGQERTVRFVRRGQEHVSIIDPVTNEPGLIPLDRVVVQ